MTSHVELSFRICTDLWVSFPWGSVKILPLLREDNCRSAKIFTDVQNSYLQIFSVSVTKIKAILEILDISKARGPGRILPVFFKQLAARLSVTLNMFYRNVKRLRKLPKKWKTGQITPILKKGDKAVFFKYRPLKLLNIVSKVSREACTKMFTISSTKPWPEINMVL